MTPELTASFNRFKASLAEANFSLFNIFEFVADAVVNGQNAAANAILRHMCDVMAEIGEGNAIGFDELMAEGYRRTFCDPVAAAKYGTLDHVQDEKGCCDMMDGMASLLHQMAGVPSQQALDLISTDTTGHAH